MKFDPVFTGQFKRDVKRIKARGKDDNALADIMTRLINGEMLDPWHKDHKLVGNYAGRRECHIEPDWLLIYKIDGQSIIFERTGTHSDLFC
ncbi:MAG: type II toxin-antitoxin system YafQ family toxin [Nitrospirales bacterium]|nr:type II toxin-antitoxin system YafQ family toxin [Nitrospirales bacterium]